MKNPDYKPNPFESVIKRYLDERAASDTQFAAAYVRPGKNITSCCNYIISEVRKSGRTAFANEEIYGLAVHYYDEAGLGEVASAPKCRIVTPAHSDPDAPSPRPQAKKPKAAPARAAAASNQMSLFDF